MSYELLVFAPESAPVQRDAFLAWWEQQAQWSEDHDYDDPKVSTPELRAWLMEMIETFPPMNGPLSSGELPDDEAAATDYSVGKHVIYAAFAWSRAEFAREAVVSLAGKHRVGFFDASGTGAVWLPNGKGGLDLAHAGVPGGG